MTNRKELRTAGVILILLLGLGVTSADDFTFDVTNGIWGDFENWIGPPNRFPGPGDKAIIPLNLTCEVSGARTTEIVTVNSGGTLVIDDAGSLTIINNDDDIHDTPLLTVNGTLIIESTLTMNKAAGNSAEPKLTVNDTLSFEVDNSSPKILYGGTLTIDGTSGTIQALGQNGHSGLITSLNSPDVVEIESGVTVKGSITIECFISTPGMKLDGTFIVDHASDVMVLGEELLPHFVRGASSGLFHVSAGEMRIEGGMAPDPDFAGTFRVSGTGAMSIMRFTFGSLKPLPTAARVEVAGGTLDLQRSWTSYGGFEFTGGTIKVKQPFYVIFVEGP